MLYFWIVIVVVAFAAVLKLTSAYLRSRGARAVTCPDNHAPVGIEVDALRAAFTGFLGDGSLRVKECTRWPEKAGCGQECLRAVEAAEDGCLVRSILAHWYTGKSCVSCGREFGTIDWIGRKPGLLAPDGISVDWADVRPEDLSSVLDSHAAICFDCHVAETFRRTHPELVVDRPRERTGPPPRP